MDLKKTRPSKNFLDRTGDDLSKIDWIQQLGQRAMMNQWGADPRLPTYEEGTKGLSKEDLHNLLFQKVLEEFGGYYMNKWPEPNHFPQGRGPLKEYGGRNYR